MHEKSFQGGGLEWEYSYENENASAGEGETYTNFAKKPQRQHFSKIVKMVYSWRWCFFSKILGKVQLLGTSKVELWIFENDDAAYIFVIWVERPKRPSFLYELFCLKSWTL